MGCLVSVAVFVLVSLRRVFLDLWCYSRLEVFLEGGLLSLLYLIGIVGGCLVGFVLVWSSSECFSGGSNWVVAGQALRWIGSSNLCYSHELDSYDGYFILCFVSVVDFLLCLCFV